MPSRFALRQRLKRSGDPVRVQMAVVMAAFMVGLFAGPEEAEDVQDNLDLERWFRLPKGHERRIHGRQHAGVCLVQEEATLMPVLDARKERGTQPSGTAAGLPASQAPHGRRRGVRRRKIMRQARSKKRRPVLLAELQQRYQAAP
jgi:hypothetical protein